ncbi:hypothetical protein Curie_20 [Microbacterium phage Curie]
MPITIVNIRLYTCTKCTYRSYTEDMLTAHILDNLCPQNSNSYHARKVTD